jgi:ERCC4-type nuclease
MLMRRLAPGNVVPDAGDDANPVRIVADVNEPDDLVDMVAALGVAVKRRRLAPADFVVGPVAIERKAVGDFQRSLVDGRLWEQLDRLKTTYEPPIVLLLEGDLALVEEFQQPRAFWSALAGVAIDPAIHVLPTAHKGASAEALAALARRAGQAGLRSVVRFKPRMLGPDVELKFAVQGIPGVGDVMSERLLARFGTLRALTAASQADLARVPGVGAKRAADITAFLDRAYGGARAAPRGEQARLDTRPSITRRGPEETGGD